MLPLPTDPLDRTVFFVHYGDKFNGDNDAEALSYARFAVFYLKGLKIGPYAAELAAQAAKETKP